MSSVKLQQLKVIQEVVKQQLNVTAAAEALYTSQPGLSKQIKQLEDELGVVIFERSGRQLKSVTPAGIAVMNQIERVLSGVEGILHSVEEFKTPDIGTLSIATTHTQARYVLPKMLYHFVRRYPKVKLNMHQGTPIQIAKMAASGEVDLCLATEAMELFEDLVMLPCYHWNRCILTPCDHPLREQDELTLEAVAQYPILTYTFGFTGRSTLDRAFNRKMLKPNVVFTASDADVIKTYVRLGLGIGIIAKMAYDPAIDTDMCALDASHLFESNTSKFGLRRGSYLRHYIYDFIERFSPHLTPEMVSKAIESENQQQIDQLFKSVELPKY